MKNEIFNNEAMNKDDAIEAYYLRPAPTTIKKMEKLEKEGYRFVPGNNRNLNKTKKWSQFDCIRVALTNSRNHGKSIATMWAVK